MRLLAPSGWMLQGDRTPGLRPKGIYVTLTIILVALPLISIDQTMSTGHPISIEIPVVDNPFAEVLNWTNDTRLTFEPHHSTNSDLAVEGENLHLVWADERYRNHFVRAVPPYDQPKRVTYSIYATDFAGNFNTTPLYSFEVTAQDTIPPEIEHCPIVNRTIGRKTVIEAIVRDNSQVEGVRLDYVDLSGKRSNVSMDLLYDPSENPKYYFTYRATIPPQLSEGTLKYFIWAKDVKGNTNRTKEQTISISSEDINPPIINHNSPRTKLPGYEIYIEAKVLDDAEVEAVVLDYVDVKGETHRINMLPRGNNTYSFGIPPQPSVGTLNYSIWSRDINGNENRTSSYSIEIVSEDKEPPTIAHPRIKGAVVGYWIPMHAFVQDNFGFPHNVRLSVDGGMLMMPLLSTDGVDQLYYKRSTDSGRTWDDGLGHVGVDRPLTYRGNIHFPRIAVEGDNIHIVYGEGYPHGIYYLVSRDNGATWSTQRMLASSAQSGDIAVHGNLVYIAWVNWHRHGHLEQRLHLTLSTDGGRTWSHEGKLNETLIANGPGRTSLDGAYLHVVTGEYGTPYLRYMRGKWNGNGFFWDDGRGKEREARIVASNHLALPYPPQDYALSAREGKLHLVFIKEIPHYTRKLWCDGSVYDFYTPYYQLYHVVSLDAGSTWSTPTLLVDHDGIPWDHHTCDPLYDRPQGYRIWDTDMALDESTVHVFWSDTRADNSTLEVNYKTGDGQGGNWSNDTRLTFNESFDSAGVAVAIWDHTLHLSWSDGRDRWWGTPFPSGHPKEIYYKRFPRFPSVRPPARISASLEGDVYQDVNISWERSPDDIVGSNPVLRYELYYSTEYSRPGDDYQLLTIIDANGSDSYYFVHRNAGKGDPNNYFYRVVAIDSNNDVVPCLFQVSKYARWLPSGIHLISIPLELRENRVDKVFQTLDFRSIWYYDSLDQTWRSCHQSKPYCFFPAIERSMAFWVDVRQDEYLTVAGAVPLTTWVRLEEGWNLVGYPSFKNKSAINAFAGVNVHRLEAYDVSSPPYHLRLLSKSEQMTYGDGYWVYSNVPQYWVLKN